jgi:putative transposase
MRKNNQFHYQAKFLPEVYYHVYNRTNNKELLYRDDEDYLKFLHLTRRFLSGWVDVFAYSLLPNHFHFGVKIKSKKELVDTCGLIDNRDLTKIQRLFLANTYTDDDFHILVTRRFLALFIAYADYFNLKYSRSGNLFYRPFKRVSVDNDGYRQWLVYYIHNNAKKHGITDNYRDYRWSSFPVFLTSAPSNLSRNVLYEIFETKENYVRYHQLADDEHAFYSSIAIEI